MLLTKIESLFKVFGGIFLFFLGTFFGFCIFFFLSGQLKSWVNTAGIVLYASFAISAILFAASLLMKYRQALPKNEEEPEADLTGRSKKTK